MCARIYISINGVVKSTGEQIVQVGFPAAPHVHKLDRDARDLHQLILGCCVRNGVVRDLL